MRLLATRHADVGAWEYEVLDHCFNEVDFISLHAYFSNDSNDITRVSSPSSRT